MTVIDFTSATVERTEQVDTPEALEAEHVPTVLPVPPTDSVGVNPEIKLLFESRTVTVTVEIAEPFAMTGDVAVISEFEATAAPTVNVAEVESPAKLLTVIDFVSATVELTVQVDTPEALEVEQLLTVFPDPPTVIVGSNPGTGLLFASRTVIVTVEVADPLATTGEVALIEELAARADPAVKAAEVESPAILLTVIDFISAKVELIVHVDIPEPFVAEQRLTVLEDPPTVKFGTNPEIILLFKSLTVIVTVETAEPFATTGEVADISELLAIAVPAVKTAEVESPARLLTEIVLVSATVELIVQVDTPEAFVAEQALTELDEPPTVRVGTKPEIRLLFESRTVTVTVEVAEPFATTGDVAVIFEFAANAVPAVKVAEVESPARLPTEIDLVSATVELMVHVETPEASVAEQALTVFDEPPTVRVGTKPEITLLFASLTVIETIEVAEPFATTGEVAETVELAARAEPGINTAVVESPARLSTEMSFDSATVELIVHVEIPEAFVAEQVFTVFPEPPTVRVGINPEITLLLLSRTVIVTVEVEDPFATTGEVALIEEFAARADPAVNKAEVESPAKLLTEIVLFSATVELTVQVETPDPLVAEQALTVFPVPPTDKVGIKPLTGLLFASLTVTVTVEVAEPFATTGEVAEISELAARAGPWTNVLEVPSPLILETSIDLTSALVELIVHVETPEAFVAEQALTVFADPPTVRDGTKPEIKLLFASRTVIVTSEVAEPFATTGDVAVISELAARADPAVKVTEVPTPLKFETSTDLTSATVELIVQLEIPEALVAEHAFTVLDDPPTVRVGTNPETRLL